jgi:hypothetical protein
MGWDYGPTKAGAMAMGDVAVPFSGHYSEPVICAAVTGLRL